MTQKYRLIEKGTYDAYTNMAIDEALVISVRKNKVPIIRFYNFEKKSITLGINQNSNDINLEYCKENDIDIVRRPTGGQALFHDVDDFTYCVIVNPEGRYKEFMDSYREIASWIIDSFSLLGIKTIFDNSSSILADNKKICGNAQTRVLGPILQHGSIFYSLDLETLEKIFKIKKEIIKEKTISILNFNNFSFNQIHSAFKEGFLKGKEFYVDEISKEEWKTVNELLKNKYKTDRWNFNKNKPVKGSCHVQWEEILV
jgi:lipoate-protein ligase A